MTKKKDIVKLNKLHLIKHRRMQKFHARKAVRLCKTNEGDARLILFLQMFVSIKYLNLDSELRKHVGTYKIRFQ
jgi:hypothetical protein